MGNNTDIVNATGLSGEDLELLGYLLEEEREGLSKSQNISRRSQPDRPPLSFAQQRLWFLNQLEPESSAYNIHLASTLDGPLNLCVFERAINEIVRRHESLRTTFQLVDGRPVQVISPSAHMGIPMVDLRDWDSGTQLAQVFRLARQEAQRPFDLSCGPLLRMSMLCLGEERFVLLFTVHHIVFDEWSMAVFVREIVELYKAFSCGNGSPLADLPIQYADFAVWQRERLQGEALEEQLGYWKQELGEYPPVLELPTDRVRPAMQTYRGANLEFKWKEELSRGLRRLSLKHEATLFMTLLGAFDALLCRYSGQEEVLIGTPVANRTRQELEVLIGFFVNTLVLKGEVRRDSGFPEILGRVRERALGAYMHQDLPFERLVEALHLERDMARPPLFQVMLTVQNTPQETLELAGVKIDNLGVDRGGAILDLNLVVVDVESELRGRLEYNTDLFEEISVKRILNHLEVLLEAVVADPARNVWDLPLMNETELRQILTDWNATGKEIPRASLSRLFEAQAYNSADAVAIVFEDAHLSYAELNRRANQLGHYLRKQGVRPEITVGICMERSVELVIGLFGTLKAGGAYVPLDSEYPARRLEYMAKNSACPIMLVHTSTKEVAPNGSVNKIINLEREWHRIAAESDVDCVTEVEPGNLVYVIYTSGSTGKPKGVMNTQIGITNRLCWMQDAYRLEANDRVLQKTPFSFDVSVWEFFWPLLNGACLVAAQPGGHRDTTYLKNVITEQQITVLHFVPSMLSVFMESVGEYDCVTLKNVICSGEALPQESAQRFYSSMEGRLHNLYGPTEAAIDVTFHECRAEYTEMAIPIGRPISNTQMYVLGDRCQPNPIGVVGELHIGGVGLARGYLNNSDLTAERFRPHPFSGEGGQRLYRTGDLGRCREDGNLEYHGRIDHQVKIRGNRVELGEIEAVLLGHQGVRDAAVVIQEKNRDKRLVAYWVCNKGAQPGPIDLRNYLKEKLPEYMLPAALVQLESMPLNTNGKVDRKALPEPPEPENSVQANDAAFAAPQSEWEKSIASIWLDALAIEKVGIHDNFFNLGGHSLMLAEIHHRLLKIAPRPLTMMQLFKYPTISSLAAYLSESDVRSFSPAPVHGRAAMRAKMTGQQMHRRRNRSRVSQ